MQGQRLPKPQGPKPPIVPTWPWSQLLRPRLIVSASGTIGLGPDAAAETKANGLSGWDHQSWPQQLRQRPLASPAEAKTKGLRCWDRMRVGWYPHTLFRLFVSFSAYARLPPCGQGHASWTSPKWGKWYWYNSAATPPGPWVSWVLFGAVKTYNPWFQAAPTRHWGMLLPLYFGQSNMSAWSPIPIRAMWCIIQILHSFAQAVDT
jgi:hypothetical protein